MRASCRPHRKLGPKKPQEPHVSQTRFLSSINKPSGVEKNREDEYCKAKMARKGDGFRVLAARYRTCWPVREKGSCGLCHSRCLPGQRGLHGSPAFSHPNRELLVSGAASHTMVFHTGLSALSVRGTLTLHQRNNGPLNTNHHIWGMDVKKKNKAMPLWPPHIEAADKRENEACKGSATLFPRQNTLQFLPWTEIYCWCRVRAFLTGYTTSRKNTPESFPISSKMRQSTGILRCQESSSRCVSIKYLSRDVKFA